VKSGLQSPQCEIFEKSSGEPGAKKKLPIRRIAGSRSMSLSARVRAPASIVMIRADAQKPPSIGFSCPLNSGAAGTTDIDLSGVRGEFEVKWFNPRAGGPLLEGYAKWACGWIRENSGVQD
jgi:hypothetical protein